MTLKLDLRSHASRDIALEEDGTHRTSTDGETFLAWIERMLVPALRPGDIVVMHNLAVHKVAGVRQAIEACGAELRYLPPYIPDLNPIENAFAKLKAHVRKSAARTLDTLERAAANALQRYLTNAQTSSLTPDTAWIKRICSYNERGA
jgi:transposase